MSNVLLSKLSSELADLDGQVSQIDQQISQLRRKKAELIQKKQALERKIEMKTNEDSDVVLDRWDQDSFPWSDEANQILKNKFRLEKFRPLQSAAINAVMSKEDAIVILSTGGGKSLCYQLPALLAKGLTLVISPLVSLVEDQIMQLQKLGIDAASLNANTPKDEAKRVEQAITKGSTELRLLYVTPEKLAKSKRMMNQLEKSLGVGYLKLIAIDEVHCCSQWGHDFRTDYSFLNVLKRQFKGVPILGLTATATSNVLDDVKKMLGIPVAIVFRAGFNRANLNYKVLTKPGSEDECVEKIVRTIKRKFSGKTGIIYCLSRNDCEKLAKSLKANGIRAKHYHAYMEPVDRSAAHQKWVSGEIQVIVATVAFGMGIDKPDVRFVIHHSLPKSIENYYQESGRAGRDGLPATCILYYRMSDIFKQSSMIQQEQTGIANLYNMVRYASDTVTCRRVKLAEHFEEAWEPSWCQKQCDVCEKSSNSPGTATEDVSKEAVVVINIIEENLSSAKDGSGRITGNKLLDLLSKKLKGRRTKDFCEKLIVHLLLESYLQEDFHYTVYSVISYVVVGLKWRVYNRKDEIPMTLDNTKKGRAEENNRKRKAAVTSSDEEVDVGDDDDMPTNRSNLSILLTHLSRVDDDRMDTEEVEQRSSTAFRPLSVKCGVFGAQDGSGYAEFGNTRVLAQILGPDGDGKWEEDHAKVVVTLKGVENETSVAEWRAELTSSASAVIFVNKYPGKVIEIEITVLSDDGGVLSTAITAMALALAHSGIEHMGLTASVHVAMRPNGDYITDPSTSESSGILGGVTFAFVPNLDQTTCVDLYGRISLKAARPLLEFARQRAITIVPAIHKAIVNSVKERKL
ncbi:hypothetical protein L5515_002892 [Caenorhabditis briggsae]|uniref:ATP-dependent DNA helicase n=2 Tax=Caenorhabditis briggsae TaxID=6238 RepID=A0AAE9JAS4_CAEBR|nr:hypothetical protein L5515_002892 [Caenorhabditis briggsae]